MKTAQFAPEARGEFDAAAEWYEGHSAGLGEAFMAAVEATVERIVEAPTTFPVWERDLRFRRAVLQRFPYLVFYRETGDAIEIIAVAHGARDPGYWVKR